MRHWILTIVTVIEDLLSGTHSPLIVKSSNSLQEKNLNEENLPLNILFSQYDPGNQFCADGGVKDPLWASINLGILICIGKFHLILVLILI